MVCPAGTVRAMALSQSLPTPKTQELATVVVRLAEGAPEDALALAVAPMAPDPPVPLLLAPVKVTTVIDAATLTESVAFTETLLSTEGANARHTSAVPSWVFVRRTSVQVRLAPVMPVTVVLVPEPGLSAEMNASSSSFAAVVVKVGLVMVVELLLRSVDSVLSMASAALGVTVSVAVWLTPA